MTKVDYETKRKTLYDQASQLIENDKLDEADEKMDEINKLDEQWQAYADAQANLHMLSDDPWDGISPEMQAALRQMHGSGETLNNVSGTVIPGTARHSDPLYLSNTRSMMNYAVEHGANSDPLVSGHALGDVVKGMVTGKWSSQDLKNLVTTSTTGTIIPEVLSAQVIDLARNKSLFTSANVPTVAMTTNNMKISRIASDPVFGFKAEGEEGKEVGVDIDAVKLEAKTVYGWAYVTLEAIESSENLNDILLGTFANAIAEAIDQGMLYGEDGAEYAPEGVMNSEDILSLDASNAGYDDFVIAQAMIRQKNYDPSVWAINAYTDQTLSMLKDNEGRYLGAPETLTGMLKVVSNQLAYDEENGSDGLVFDPTSMLIGIQNDVRIKMIEDEKALKNGLVGFQVYAMLDCKVVKPNAICRIKGLK